MIEILLRKGNIYYFICFESIFMVVGSFWLGAAFVVIVGLERMVEVLRVVFSPDVLVD